MDYATTLEHLYRLERFGIKLGLENIRRLLSLLGDPHRDLRILHVTGTNGKGSVCAYAASVLQQAGYHVGLYTSPHLVRFNERIQVNRTPIADDDVLRLWSGMQPAIHAMTSARAINHPTFFEVTTAMAFEYFREGQVDVAVIEVGMGGRMDATNVADGLVSVLTRVDLEHTEHLGKTVNRIAREKAGIVKPSSRAVTVAQPALSVIEARCREVHAPLLVVGRDVYAERGARDLRGQDLRVRGSFGEIEARTPRARPGATSRLGGRRSQSARDGGPRDLHRRPVPESKDLARRGHPERQGPERDGRRPGSPCNPRLCVPTENASGVRGRRGRLGFRTLRQSRVDASGERRDRRRDLGGRRGAGRADHRVHLHGGGGP